ncbi:uncharacterized protein LOC132039469 [Lycium ferocissimum]|uniref:uncharacterized protein LOC132039469 n=1 Tax=Lycium ferocissimum TaxID=112874 RepID=UPI002814A596|nr:uncharacterized protein LOC132039469 [Lycium ferocissimum]
MCSCDVWKDNWNRLGPLREFSTPYHNIEEVAELMNSEGWEFQKMNAVLPDQVVDHVKYKLSIMGQSIDADVPWWILTKSSKLTVSSALNVMRQQEQESLSYQRIWSKGVPFKISFFLWRMWKAILPVDDALKRMDISIVSRCICYLNSQSEKTFQHIFLTGNCVAEVWQYYTTSAGIIGPLIQLHQAVVKWWNTKCAVKLKLVFEAIQSFIYWQLWKRRNALMNGANMSKSKVIYCINQNIHNLISSLYPWLKNVPHDWPQMVQLLEGLNPRVGGQMVQRRYPSAGWHKCNTDGASRGNPGQRLTAFCIRYERGDLVYAAARRIANTTNICAEAVAIHVGLQYCVNNQMLPVIMETDSLAMVNIIQGD